MNVLTSRRELFWTFSKTKRWREQANQKAWRRNVFWYFIRLKRDKDLTGIRIDHWTSSWRRHQEPVSHARHIILQHRTLTTTIMTAIHAHQANVLHISQSKSSNQPGVPMILQNHTRQRIRLPRCHDSNDGNKYTSKSVCFLQDKSNSFSQSGMHTVLRHPATP